MENKVSVIVPVYNVEQYLDKCLESITSQTYSNLEIIIVDDGSEDSSYLIYEKWKEKDDRIQIIKKINEGLGFARNTGLEMATGKYVLFVDSDDFIENNMIEKLIENIIIDKSDTIYCGIKRYFNENEIKNIPPKCGRIVYDKNEIINNVLLEMIGTLPHENEDMNLEVSVWHSLYSMDVIKKNNIKFPSERVFMSEDISFHIDYLQYANRVSFITDCLYNYRLNNNSLSMKYDENRFERSKKMYFQIYEKLSSFIKESEFKQRVQRRFLGGVRGRVLDIVGYEKKNMIKKISIVVNDPIVREVIREYPYYNNPFKHKIFNYCVEKKYCFILYLLAKCAKKQ